MSLETKWLTILPVLFTADGTQFGVVTVASTIGFRDKQVVVLSSITVPQTRYQIKRVTSPTQMIIGAVDSNLSPTNYSNITTFLVSELASIQAAEQSKTAIPSDKDHYFGIYESSPVNADRVIGVDPYGNYYTDTNPLPVAIDGTISIGEVSIVEGGNTMTVNPGGSINVNIVEAPVSGQTVKSFYGSNTVASAATVTLVSYTVPVGYTAVLERANASGGNVAQYTILINNVTFDLRRTMFGGDLTTDFDYTTGTSNGYVLNSGDNIIIQVTNPRPMAAPFNARLQVLEIV